MPDGYDSHTEYMAWAKVAADARMITIMHALESAFQDSIHERPLKVIRFDMAARVLAKLMLSYPGIVKPLCAVCNVAGRAIHRDLGITLDTYEPRLDESKAIKIATYLKEYLPDELAISALVEIDRHFFVDKTIRKMKGQWEKAIINALTAITGLQFKKSKFTVENDQFELDGAYPAEGEIKYGIDVKRIEAPRDIHKRIDEVINKATKFKKVLPEGKFGAVIYYPFPENHQDIVRRSRSEFIDALAFATQDEVQIRESMAVLASELGIEVNDIGKTD